MMAISPRARTGSQSLADHLITGAYGTVEAEVLDFGVFKNRQIANFNIGGHTITLIWRATSLGLSESWRPPVFSSSLAVSWRPSTQLAMKNVTIQITRETTVAKTKSGPQLLSAPDSIFIGQICS